MEHKFTFLTGNNGRAPDNPLGQPAATKKTDELLAALAERKGRLYAELAFFLFSTRIRVALDGRGKLTDALAAMAARLVSAVLEDKWGPAKDDKMDELMVDVEEMTVEVFKFLDHGVKH